MPTASGTGSAIARREKLFRQLVKYAYDLIVVIGVGGKISYVSPALKKRLGYRPEDILGEDAMRIVHPDDVALAREMLTGAMVAANAIQITEFRIRHRDGSYRLMEVTGKNFVQDPDIAGVLVSCRDVTERKEASEALARSERYYRLLIEYAHDIIGILNPDGTFRYLSPAASRVLGRSADDRVGRDAFEYIHPDDAARVRETFAKGMWVPGFFSRIEFRSRHRDGSWRVIELTGRNLLDDPVIAGVVVNYRDITDRKQVEAALRQREEDLRHAQKMEAVGRLAGGVSHDFNNFLTVIKGYSGLLAKRLPDGSELKADVDEIREAAERATVLTRQLLAFSRGQFLQPRVLDLNDVITDMCKMLKGLLPTGVDLATILDNGLGSVRADPGQITQVVMNLVVNARDAMPDGGTVTIATVNVELGDEFVHRHPAVKVGPHIMLSVSDAGHGMDEATLSHVFEPFFTTKAPGKGTGLGLATVYGIVRQSDGYVCGESRPGEGTTFKVYLPRVFEEVDRVAAPVPAEAAPASSATILLAEDEPAVLGLARAVLASGGYTVLDAQDGADALEVAERHDGTIDLLVTDVVMPRVSGFELASRLARIRPEARVLFMSGYADRTAVKDEKVHRRKMFLDKPFSEDELLRKVREVLDGR